MAIGWIGAGSFPLFMGVVPSETLSLRRAATAMGLVIGVGEIGGGCLESADGRQTGRSFRSGDRR